MVRSPLPGQLALPLDFAPEPVRAHGLRATARLRVIEALTATRRATAESYDPKSSYKPKNRKKGASQPRRSLVSSGALAGGDRLSGLPCFHGCVTRTTTSGPAASGIYEAFLTQSSKKAPFKSGGPTAPGRRFGQPEKIGGPGKRGSKQEQEDIPAKGGGGKKTGLDPPMEIAHRRGLENYMKGRMKR